MIKTLYNYIDYFKLLYYLYMNQTTSSRWLVFDVISELRRYNLTKLHLFYSDEKEIRVAVYDSDHYLEIDITKIPDDKISILHEYKDEEIFYMEQVSPFYIGYYIRNYMYEDGRK